jgi:hypothetical protein
MIMTWEEMTYNHESFIGNRNDQSTDETGTVSYTCCGVIGT